MMGRTWDDMPVLRLKVTDLSREAIDLFKTKAIMKGRLTEEEINVDDEVIMRNLRLFSEDDHLTRAAMLAFYHDPERWVTGSYIKIGYFEDDDADLRYQDEIHGPLITQADKAIDLIYTKYMKALISYDGLQRIEKYMFPKEAAREILLNAIVHKDYASCNPIQVSVYPDRMYVWNAGRMPKELARTVDLFHKHSSIPFNPKLAGIFFKCGLIEASGRGFDKIKRACEKHPAPLPEYTMNSSGIMVLCRACVSYLQLLRPQAQQNKSDIFTSIMDYCSTPRTANEILARFKISTRVLLRRTYLNPMLADGRLCRTLPEKPRSQKQKYYSLGSPSHQK